MDITIAEQFPGLCGTKEKSTDWFALPNVMFDRETNITPNEKLLLITLIKLGAHAEVNWSPYRQLALLSRLGLNTCQKILKNLILKGYLVRHIAKSKPVSYGHKITQKLWDDLKEAPEFILSNRAKDREIRRIQQEIRKLNEELAEAKFRNQQLTEQLSNPIQGNARREKMIKNFLHKDE